MRPRASRTRAAGCSARRPGQGDVRLARCRGGERLRDATPTRSGSRIRGDARTAGSRARQASSRSRPERGRPRVDVTGGHGPPEPRLADEFGERVALGRHDREPGPDVVEQPRAEGEACLESSKCAETPMSASTSHAPRSSYGHPPLVEEDEPVADAELSRQPSARRASLSSATAAFGRPRPDEDEADIGWVSRDPCDRADHGQRVEPAPDPAAPEQDLRSLADAREHAAQHGLALRTGACCRCRTARRRQGREGRVAVVGVRVDRPERAARRARGPAAARSRRRTRPRVRSAVSCTRRS